jgi:site-specific DNA-methyltransferase (adenine-specific)
VTIEAVLAGEERWTVEHVDASEFSESLPADSVDLLLTDPPFFKVKDEAWDRQWDAPAEFLSWLGGLFDKWRRVLKPNGSLYVFASPQMSARVEVEVGHRFAVLNHVVWSKSAGWAHGSEKDAMRSFFPASERIIFAEHYGADNAAKGEAGYGAKCDELRGFVFEPLRAYLDGERERAGMSAADCNAACGNLMAGHYFTQSQWALPTRANYEKLRDLFNGHGGQHLRRDYEHLRRDYEHLRRDYEHLRREYEDLRREYEDLRRPFSVTKDVPYTDVWTFPTVQSYPGKHPCEKPEELVAHIINASSKPDAVVCDCFAGSGVVGAVAVALGRRFIGCELDPLWVERAQARIQVGRKLRAPEPKADNKRQGKLF